MKPPGKDRAVPPFEFKRARLGRPPTAAAGLLAIADTSETPPRESIIASFAPSPVQFFRP
jgi:hypothetical protein